MEPKYFDPEALFSLLGDNKATIIKMLEHILKGASKKHLTFRENVVLKDWPIVKGEAHFLKSNFRYLGAKDMANLLKQVEHLALEDDADKTEIQPLVDKFYDQYPIIINEVEEYLTYLRTQVE